MDSELTFCETDCSLYGRECGLHNLELWQNDTEDGNFSPDDFLDADMFGCRNPELNAIAHQNILPDEGDWVASDDVKGDLIPLSVS